jgi:ParB family chromosome partitioning protein
MRYAKKAPDVSDILPTVRKRGVIVPVLVRPNGTPETFEIVAGARRFTAASIVADERRAEDGTRSRCPAPSCRQRRRRCHRGVADPEYRAIGRR